MRDCEDCEQGKHTGCLIEVWDDAADDWVPCPCDLRGHIGTSSDWLVTS